MPKKIAKSKTTRRIKENDLQVTLSPQPGSMATGDTTVDVNASDPVQAIQQATAQMPGKKFAAVQVAPKGTSPTTPVQNTTPAPTTPNQVDPGNPLTKPGAPAMPTMESLARFQYPYGIVVPKQFEEVIAKAVKTGKRVIEGVVLGESYGRITVEIKSPAAMATFVTRLNKSRDRYAITILEGIKNST